MNYPSSSKILTDRQFAFLPKYFTIKTVTNLIEKVLKSLDEKDNISSVLCDLANAFDCVSHDSFLKKLEHKGMQKCSKLAHSIPHRQTTKSNPHGCKEKHISITMDEQ